MGFFRFVILFIGMKSQTLTRQIFSGRHNSNLILCGKRENGLAYKW